MRNLGIQVPHPLNILIGKLAFCVFCGHSGRLWQRAGATRPTRTVLFLKAGLDEEGVFEDGPHQLFGLVVRSRGLGGNVMASLRSLGGGEIHEYTSLLEDTRRQALDRLVQNATLLGANAVLSMRFDSSELSGTMSEIVAYGTAVVVAPDGSTAPTTPVE